MGHLTIPIFASLIGWLMAVLMFLLEVWAEHIKYQRVQATNMAMPMLNKNSKTNYVEFAKLQE